jgi:diguanylate cyclase (GGDEF)-like protein
VRVLIADDDITSRLILKAMVSRLGHETLMVADGDEAWTHLAGGNVDVLLTDWMMPGIDGAELCRRARYGLGSGYVYVVLITSRDCPKEVLEGMTAGADDYLVKPVDKLVLETRLMAAERMTELHRNLARVKAELELANRELLAQSLTDPLTGLANRRRMEEDLHRVHEHSLRHGAPYAIAMFDVDHFKSFNDRYGHPAGDEILTRVASSLRQAIRAADVVYRYGGEEFLVLMADTGPDDALTAAERARAAVAGQAIEHTARPSLPHVVTVSGGVSVVAPGPGSVDEVLAQADHALFAAKDEGRNRVVGSWQRVPA